MTQLIFLTTKFMIKGYKTYTGIIMIILGMTGVTKYLPEADANELVDKIFEIINMSMEVGGIILAVVGAIHKDIRLKKPV